MKFLLTNYKHEIPNHLLLLLVRNNAVPIKWNVTQHIHGQDVPYCGNVSFPCRTIRFTVDKANSGDTIYIDNANGKPYRECDKSPNAIQLKMSLSFICPNGMAEVQCRLGNNIIFEIPNDVLGNQIISFTSIKFTSANSALKTLFNDTRILIRRCLFQGNNIAIYMRNQGKCHLQVDNSIFIDNKASGIYGKCGNIMVRLSNTTFRASAVSLSDVNGVQGSRKLDKYFKVFIEGSYFYGNVLCNHHNAIVEESLFLVKCRKATILNISVVASTFASSKGNLKYKASSPGPISIQFLTNKPDVIATIYFNQVTVKNISTKQRNTLFLSLPPRIGLGSNITILNCQFFNNTRALEILIKTTQRDYIGILKLNVAIKNTMFIHNYNNVYGSGAAATLSRAIYTIVDCKFINNHYEKRYLTGVVVLLDKADATFESCYFENAYVKKPEQRVLQIYSPGNTNVRFKTRNVFNIENLRVSQPIIIHATPYTTVPGTYNGKMKLHGKIRLTCPVGYIFVNYTTPESLKNNTVFHYLEFACLKCPYKTYSLERGGFSKGNLTPKIKCHDCPRAAVCTGEQLRPRPNFWGNKNSRNGEVSFLSCPLGYCCQNDQECKAYDSCHGNRIGTLCGRCNQGTSELLFGTECQPNKDCESKFIWIGISVIVPLYCLFFLYYNDIVKFLTTAFFASSKIRSQKLCDSPTESNSTEPHPLPMLGGYLKIIFYYYQIIHIFNSSIGDRGQAFKLIDHFVTPMFNFLVSANMFSLRCPFKDLHPIHKVAILNSLGFLLLIFIGLLFIAWKVITAFKRSRLDSKPLYIDAVVQKDESDGTSDDFQDQKHKTGQSFKCRIASAFTRISLLMYSSTAQLCLSLLHCVPIEDHKVLFIDGTLKCYQIFQYFAFVYVALNIIPFCLVPILGSYLLTFDSICLTEFCLGCLFPLPFCINWALLLFKMWRGRFSEGYVAVSSLKVVSTPRSAILQVLLGPFRSHSTFLGFPESPIPWEGFLIFRRLVIILLFTFVYDVNLRMCLVLVACVIILILHLVVKPFKRQCDNILETFSLGILIILCGFTYVKAINNGGDEAALNLYPHLYSLISIIEAILIVTPLLVSFLLIFCTVVFVFLVWLLKLMLHLRNKLY